MDKLLVRVREILNNLVSRKYITKETYLVLDNCVSKQQGYVIKQEQWIDTKCNCGYCFSKTHYDGYYTIPYENKTNYCPNCGQKLIW